MCIGCAVGGAVIFAGVTYASGWFLLKKVIPFMRSMRGEKP
jgi:hypothetical protein